MPLPFIIAGGIAAAAVTGSYAAYEALSSSGSSGVSEDDLRRAREQAERKEQEEKKRESIKILSHYAERQTRRLAEEYGLDRQAVESSLTSLFDSSIPLNRQSSVHTAVGALTESSGLSLRGKDLLYRLVARPLLAGEPASAEEYKRYLRKACATHINDASKIKELETSIAEYEQAVQELEKVDEHLG